MLILLDVHIAILAALRPILINLDLRLANHVLLHVELGHMRRLSARLILTEFAVRVELHVDPGHLNQLHVHPTPTGFVRNVLQEHFDRMIFQCGST
jgi:hypothetical protein